ncbi:pyrroline-5-carboxylate reductase [Usitatibacter palustris]|uniref:Pyrroline-5-carboxylate reductase n=1 Tax=Usitatibacter palustris TaxID=2732487 RepID=A0A6M4H1M0_9PROT|nr:pyrroline-5-carboxylate reductase [Usitatibacter palustris]QJR13350.1 Pyrroline-5-carboxylate reductase [Usitatibacter palustris]
MKLAFIGGGNMATAILGGLMAKGFRGADAVVAEIDAAARARLASELGVSTVEAPGAEMARVDVIVLAVKPQNMREVAKSLAPHLSKQLVVSIAAGIRIADLTRWLGGHSRIVRAMPNTPALVQAGITGLYATDAVTLSDREKVNELLAAIGATVWLDSEGDIDIVTAISGSGPAYVFYVMEALEAAAKDLGLAPDKARTLALWTFAGGAKLAAERGLDPAVLRAQVTSKGGTTQAAISVLDAAQVKAMFVAAIKAAHTRSQQLGDEFGKDPQS